MQYDLAGPFVGLEADGSGDSATGTAIHFLDDTAGTSSRSGGVAPDSRDPRQSEPKRALEPKAQPGGAIALALERAKLKK